MPPSLVQHASPWPHRLAVCAVGVTFLLIGVGGLVTTYDAGMAVPDWPETYGYNLFLYPWQTWLFGPWDLFIEHGHRLLGATVGLLAIGLVATVYRLDSRRWVLWLAAITLAAVCVQGVLGGMRVRMNDVLLARIHGCCGPAVFALFVALAAVTSRWWRDAQALSHDNPALSPGGAAKLQRLSLITTGLAYLQLILGSHLRHMPAGMTTEAFRAAVWLHLAVATALVVHVALLAGRGWRRPLGMSLLRRPIAGLVLLMLAQLVLGPTTWVLKYGFPAFVGERAFTAAFTVEEGTLLTSLTTTAHVAIGWVVLVLALLTTLRSFRLLRPIVTEANEAAVAQRRNVEQVERRRWVPAEALA